MSTKIEWTRGDVKQLGTVWSVENGWGGGKGGLPEQWPADLRVREFPRTEVPA